MKIYPSLLSSMGGYKCIYFFHNYRTFLNLSILSTTYVLFTKQIYISSFINLYVYLNLCYEDISYLFMFRQEKNIVFLYIYKNIVLIFGKLFLKITINPHFMIINSIIYTKQTYHLYNIQPYRKTTKYQFLTMISTENKKIALLLLYITGIGLNNTLFKMIFIHYRVSHKKCPIL